MSVNISRIVYHVDMSSHAVSIHGMKTVYTAVADQGSGPGPRPSLISRSGRTAPPPPPPPPPPLFPRGPVGPPPPPPPLYLKVFIRHCSCAREWNRNISDMWRSTFKINATQLGSVTEPAPKSLCEENPYEASSDMVFVPV